LLLWSIFFCILSPIALVARMCGYNPLTLGFNPNRKSYWIIRSAHKDKASYFKQF
jgi:hypothetical protein